MNLLNEREKTHGKFEEVARVSQELKTSFGIVQLTLPPVHAEALDLICMKMARIVCGDHNEIDHWTDIKGYAELVLRHIKSVHPGSSSIQEPSDDPNDDNSSYYIPRSGLPR